MHRTFLQPVFMITTPWKYDLKANSSYFYLGHKISILFILYNELNILHAGQHDFAIQNFGSIKGYLPPFQHSRCLGRV